MKCRGAREVCNLLQAVKFQKLETFILDRGYAFHVYSQGVNVLGYLSFNRAMAWGSGWAL